MISLGASALLPSVGMGVGADRDVDVGIQLFRVVCFVIGVTGGFCLYVVPKDEP